MAADSNTLVGVGVQWSTSAGLSRGNRGTNRRKPAANDQYIRCIMAYHGVRLANNDWDGKAVVTRWPVCAFQHMDQSPKHINQKLCTGDAQDHMKGKVKLLI